MRLHSQVRLQAIIAEEIRKDFDSVGPANDDSDIEFGNKLLDAVDITDNGDNIEAALENLKIQVIVD